MCDIVEKRRGDDDVREGLQGMVGKAMCTNVSPFHCHRSTATTAAGRAARAAAAKAGSAASTATAAALVRREREEIDNGVRGVGLYGSGSRNRCCFGGGVPLSSVGGRTRWKRRDDGGVGVGVVGDGGSGGGGAGSDNRGGRQTTMRPALGRRQQVPRQVRP
ncbi:hypothetical protein QTP88_009528 [Uroleucon formosanum]